MTKYLRAKTNGIVSDWNDRLAANPDWEVVTEREAFPERFAPVELAKRETQVQLAVPEEVLAPPTVAVELTSQKGQTFGKMDVAKTYKKQPKPEIVGLGEF